MSFKTPRGAVRGSVCLMIVVGFCVASEPESAFSFSFRQAGSFDAGPEPYQTFMVLHDVDSDGNLDLILSVYTGTPMTVFRGDGKGGFGPGTSLNGSVIPSSAVMADLDGDGDDDLVVGDSDASGFYSYLSRGDGTFAEGRYHSFEHELAMVATGDLNEDGKPDVATGKAVFLNSADGNLVLSTTFTVGGRWHVPFVKDYDGDGHLDIILSGDTDTELHFLHGRGDGTFEDPAEIPLDEGKVQGLADVDGDGETDLFTGSSGCCVRLGYGDGTFHDPVCNDIREWEVRAFADFDGDGRPEIVAASIEAEDPPPISLLRDGGNGAFVEESTIDLGLRVSAFAVGDLDGDGRVDFLARSATEVLVFLNEPFDAPRFARGDVNDDGKWNLTDAVAVLSYLFVSGPVPTCLQAADSNDDGSLDLTDAVVVLTYLFLGGSPPAPPFPDCGTDDTLDELSCLSREICP
jgi:hypothetical protein